MRLTRIYTRGGDAGETSLGDGSRVSKLDARIVAFGTVDELNAALGVVLAGDVPDELRPTLERIQNELFDVGADLSVPRRGRGPAAGRAGDGRPARGGLRPASTTTSRSSRASCSREARRPRPASTSPGRSAAAPSARRSRAAQEHRLDPLVAVYLNRLSDLLFILARAANALAGRDEPLWKPGATRR